ncbi:MAG: glycosyltransferase family 4 protein [Ignavibacteriales bacterium]|nr:glycosyltransferase family 4 protein [Ignavibacteriales bacterium]
MRILFVCSGNAGYISPFIKEQAEAITALENDVLIYPIVGKGILGYLGNLSNIKKKIQEFSPALIHAHYGLSGLVSCFQRTVPVVITFHGSDAYIFYVKLLSKLAALLSSFNIFVESKIGSRIKGHNKNAIVPCGTHLDVFYPISKSVAREMIGLIQEEKYILFSSRFDNSVKNYQLAKKSVELLNKDTTIIELINKTREEVNLLLNACDLALLTSISEGSPQFIKEAMACNCPIVSTDVGDVRWVLGNTEGCYVVSEKSNEKRETISAELIKVTSDKLQEALKFAEKVGRTKGRERIIELGLDSETVAKKIISIYKRVLRNKQ